MGRISLLVSRDFQVLVQAARSLEPEVRKQFRVQTRRAAEPIFQEEMQSRAGTRIETRALVGTARVSVRDDNVTLRSATIGRVGKVPAARVAPGAEFGNKPDRKVATTSRKGKAYTRRLGPVFRTPRRQGYVFFPSVKESSARLAALWFQTAYRTVAETFEKVK